jgi:hypothetical protein
MIVNNSNKNTKFIKGDTRLLGNSFAKGNKPNKTSFKKGDNLGNQNGFIKGQIPFNKGKTGGKLSEETRQKMLGRIPWNKNTKGIMKPNKTSFKKGMTPWCKGKKVPFKERPTMKGRIAWNKGLGNKTPENKRIHHSIEYKLWRESVFARDNYTCQKYGIKGGRLHPHHIKNFSSNPELRFAIDNGITLSKKAHKLFHKIYGVKNNTMEQLLEFLNNKNYA